MSETPLLCKACHEWFVVSADRFCANCGQAIVAIQVFPEQLTLSAVATTQHLEIRNCGWFPLYWAIEVVPKAESVDIDIKAAISTAVNVIPSYGMLLPEACQTVAVTGLTTLLKLNQATISLQLLVSSNAAKTPEILLPINWTGGHSMS